MALTPPAPQPVWLTLDASGPGSAVALVQGGAILASARDDAPQGQPGRLAAHVAGLLAVRRFDAIGVVTGPGSFTGLRAAIALARGLSDAGGAPAIGVTVGEAVFAERPVACVVTPARERPLRRRTGFSEPGLHAAGGAAGGRLHGPACRDRHRAGGRAAARRGLAAAAAGAGLRHPAGRASHRGQARARLIRHAAPAPVTAVHAQALAAIHHAAFPPAERWDAAAFAALLRTPATSGLLHAGGGLILLRTVSGEAEILTLAVVPAARRRGIGRTLLAAALAAAPNGVFLEVSARNGAALALYEAAGFAPVGHRPAYYPDGSDALVMRACGSAPR